MTDRQPIESNNRSGYRGVSWHAGNRKWLARITIDGRTRHLGYFDTPAEAAIAYTAAEDARSQKAVANARAALAFYEAKNPLRAWTQPCWITDAT